MATHAHKEDSEQLEMSLHNEAHDIDKPFRAGVFSSVEDAERAVRMLLEAGFGKDAISVLCSGEAKQRHFREFKPPHPSPEDAANAAITGGALGGILGGVAAAAVTTTAGLSLLIIGPGLLGGAIAGSLVGAMTTRGVEKEVADFYDQEVTEGQLLVAVEYHGPNADEMLPRAEHVFENSGAKPLPLAEG